MTGPHVRGFAAVALFSVLISCATQSYMGIPLVAGQADADLQQLASRARSGDKQAQLELGIMFDEGRGLGQDLTKARNLYRLAASDSGGTMWVYSPPVGNGTKGRIIPVKSGPKQAGLLEAKRRLEALGD